MYNTTGRLSAVFSFICKKIFVAYHTNELQLYNRTANITKTIAAVKKAGYSILSGN